MNGMKQKKDRSPNFSKEDKDILVELVLGKYKNIIESKKTDALTSVHKQNAWKNVALDYNSAIINRPIRSWQSLKLCYENIKKRTKKAFAQDKIELHKTGGGDYKKPTVDETGHKLIAALQAQFLPLANPFDDDADFHTEVMSELHEDNDCPPDESHAIGTQEEEQFIVLEEIPTSIEVENSIIEQVPSSESTSADLTAVASTSDELPKSRAPKRKKTDSVLDMKRIFYARRIECLEAEHKIKMEALKLDKELKELEILEKRRKLGLDDK